VAIENESKQSFRNPMSIHTHDIWAANNDYINIGIEALTEKLRIGCAYG
jgi:hypothetical protein